MKKIILLEFDSQDKDVVTELSSDEALQYILKNDFCNPHQLLKGNRKTELEKISSEDILNRQIFTS